VLTILPKPVQPVAPYLSVLKFNPDQPRQPAGSEHGGEFAKETSNPTHARRDEVEQLGKDIFEEAHRIAPGHDRSTTGGYSMYHRADVKAHIQDDLTARLKGHPAFADMDEETLLTWVQGKIDLWAETSGDSDLDAAVMQLAVQQEFGLTGAATDHLQKNLGFPLTLSGKEADQLRAFVRAEYEATQAWFKKRGITHVTALRGMDDDPRDKRLGFGYETITMQPASSWAVDVQTAFAFTTNKSNPKILTTRVPVEQVLSTCLTGRGCLAEKEILLLGKPQRAHIFGVSGDDFSPDSSDTKRILHSLE